MRYRVFRVYEDNPAIALYTRLGFKAVSVVWVLAMGFKDVVGFMDVSLISGFLKGERLMVFLRRNVVDRPLEALAMPFAAVTTSLRTGSEVWLRQGSTLDAVWASIALPGLFGARAPRGVGVG